MRSVARIVTAIAMEADLVEQNVPIEWFVEELFDPMHFSTDIRNGTSQMLTYFPKWVERPQSTFSTLRKPDWMAQKDIDSLRLNIVSDKFHTVFLNFLEDGLEFLRNITYSFYDDKRLASPQFRKFARAEALAFQQIRVIEYYEKSIKYAVGTQAQLNLTSSNVDDEFFRIFLRRALPRPVYGKQYTAGFINGYSDLVGLTALLDDSFVRSAIGSFSPDTLKRVKWITDRMGLKGTTWQQYSNVERAFNGGGIEISKKFRDTVATIERSLEEIKENCFRKNVTFSNKEDVLKVLHALRELSGTAFTNISSDTLSTEINNFERIVEELGDLSTILEPMVLMSKCVSVIKSHDVRVQDMFANSEYTGYADFELPTDTWSLALNESLTTVADNIFASIDNVQDAIDEFNSDNFTAQESETSLTFKEVRKYVQPFGDAVNALVAIQEITNKVPALEDFIKNEPLVKFEISRMTGRKVKARLTQLWGADMAETVASFLAKFNQILRALPDTSGETLCDFESHFTALKGLYGFDLNATLKNKLLVLNEFCAGRPCPPSFWKMDYTLRTLSNLDWKMVHFDGYLDAAPHALRNIDLVFKHSPPHLVVCNTDLDCLHIPNALCNPAFQNLPFGASPESMMQGTGYCKVERPILPNHFAHQAFTNIPRNKSWFTVNGMSCDLHEDCVGASDSLVNATQKPFTVAYCNKKTVSGNGVCQVYRLANNTAACGIYEPVIPYVYCSGGTAELSMASGPNKSFCGESGVCCHVDHNKTVKLPTCRWGESYAVKCRSNSECTKKNSFCNRENSTAKEDGFCCQATTVCPDTVTYPIFEPPCRISESTGASICPVRGGKCVLDRCCPALKVNANGVISASPRVSYRTTRACHPLRDNVSVVHGFCDPQTERIVVIGRRMDNRDLTTKPDYEKRCRFNR
uniref:WSN domain-containing protein n=1 Tax=Caenorhabditis japonica TaxID=281687 RepID=A0A8R1HRL7_CAEJA